MGRTLGWARVSSRQQAEDTFALEQQVRKLRAWGADEVVEEVVSGSNRKAWAERLDSILRQLRVGQYQRLVLAEWSRVFRGREAEQLILGAQALGVEVWVREEQVNLDTPLGYLRWGLEGLIAGTEVRRLAERVRDGHHDRKQQRRAFNPPFGYAISAERKYCFDQEIVPNLRTQEQVPRHEVARRLVELLLHEKNLWGASKWLHQEWGIKRSSAGLRYWLINPVLRGHFPLLSRQPKEGYPRTYRNIYEPLGIKCSEEQTHDDILLGPDQWAEVVKWLSGNRQIQPGAKGKSPWGLKGLARCGECERALTFRHFRKHGYRYLFCSHTNDCGNRTMAHYREIEKAVLERVSAKAVEILEAATIAAGKRPESAKLRALRLEKEALLDTYERFKNESLLRVIDRLQEQISIEQMESQRSGSALAANHHLLAALGDPAFWASLSQEDLNQQLRQIVSAVWVWDGQLQRIDWA